MTNKPSLNLRARFERIAQLKGFVVDADDLNGRWKQIQSAFGSLKRRAWSVGDCVVELALRGDTLSAYDPDRDDVLRCPHPKGLETWKPTVSILDPEGVPMKRIKFSTVKRARKFAEVLVAALGFKDNLSEGEFTQLVHAAQA